MKLRKTTAVAAMVTGAMAMGFGTAHAEPAAEAAQPISYSVKLVDKTVVATLKGGTFSLTEKEMATKEGKPIAAPSEVGSEAEAPKVKVLDIKDDKGNTVVSFPLEFDINGTDVPVTSEVKKDATVLEVTPEKPEGVDLSKPVGVKPIASPMENQRAMNDFASKFGIGTAIGGFVGTAIGAVVGCAFGMPLFGVGCLAGIPIGAGIGGILGTVAVGGPALVAAGVELITVLQAPEGTTQWADKPDAPK
ncbi:hypothetical protein [Nocardia cyriacigeorgica]|uniref:hypothetical protein n=1 Tax=Nocardia cyriacigeorgica TaxID=135487 RepID=UPI0002F7222E|nr:hypothetical protein [Nocardia cyriacigeorgica]MBF6287695.1 hypothetical protein [Nocardia cyriacigeorgica]MBF6495082.1 hypothetical protein [Nocardia cyriacigeorgica]TLF54838.1 hypothetical protein FEK31_22395 [Nocardia cyriacigeorgica]